MKMHIGSSFWIFVLAGILNSIELSSQSGIFTPHGASPGPLPFRKVRCPRDEQVTSESSFQIKDTEGFYVNCTPDKILLAVASVIVGYILNDEIHPIYGIGGNEIMYDEETDKQIRVDRGFLKENFGVFGPVPEETLRSRVIYPFGMFGPAGHRSPARHRSPKRPSSITGSSSPERPRRPPPVVSNSDSDPVSNFDSKSDSRPPSRGSGTPGKK